MVILDVSVPTLGRFEILDDFSIQDVSLLSTTGVKETETLTHVMRSKDAPWNVKKDVFLASLASLYNLDEKDVTFHSINEPELQVEPEET